MSLIVFRIVLLLGGAFVVLTGLNNSLGGLNTMGWLGISDFYQVTNMEMFKIRDNHVRFIGGVWTALGAFLCLAATNPLKYRQRIYLVCAAIFVAGFARFTSGDFVTVFGPDIIGSLAAELIGMPILAFWLNRLEGSSETR